MAFLRNPGKKEVSRPSSVTCATQETFPLETQAKTSPQKILTSIEGKPSLDQSKAGIRQSLASNFVLTAGLSFWCEKELIHTHDMSTTGIKLFINGKEPKPGKFVLQTFLEKAD